MSAIPEFSSYKLMLCSWKTVLLLVTFFVGTILPFQEHLQLRPQMVLRNYAVYEMKPDKHDGPANFQQSRTNLLDIDILNLTSGFADSLLNSVGNVNRFCVEYRHQVVAPLCDPELKPEFQDEQAYNSYPLKKNTQLILKQLYQALCCNLEQIALYQNISHVGVTGIESKNGSISLDVEKRLSECDLCNDFDWLFVLATGRSGSTSIMNMLNSIPKFYIGGENKAMHHLFYLPYFGGYPWFDEKLYRGMRAPSTKARKNTESVPPLSKGPYKHMEVSKRSLYCNVQQIIRNLIGHSSAKDDNKQIKVIGFKELLDLTKHSGILENFWLKAFPCARFIISYRKNLVDQQLSQKNAHFRKEFSIDVLKRRNEALLQFAQLNNHKTFLAPLEEFSSDLFQRMMEWLGVSDCSFSRIVRANNGFHSGGYVDDRDVYTQGNCSYSRKK